MDVAIDVDALVGDLSVAEQQLVEIAKALAADASMIILDEPTTALGLAEIARLHALLRRLKAQGRAILYISHRLDEVVELVDVRHGAEGRQGASPAPTESEVSIPFIVRRWWATSGTTIPKERNATGEVLLRGRGPRDTTTASHGVSASRCAAARSSASAACSAPGGPRSPARCSASTAITSGTIDLEGQAVRLRSPRAGDRSRARARAGEPQVRRAVLQFRRLPEHVHPPRSDGSAGTG